MGGIESLLSEFQKIAFSNKLVALNARIEAVHVGQLGRGFEVVADEISRQGIGPTSWLKASASAFGRCVTG